MHMLKIHGQILAYPEIPNKQVLLWSHLYIKLNSVVLVHKQTIPTD
jgi:hypothetical protein